MGTLEAWRGRGLGEVLLKRALAELRRQGVRRAIIGWMGPRGFYERLLPIDDVRRFWVLRKDLEREAR
jgi:GNAT superfamily N-acetyltransferase